MTSTATPDDSRTATRTPEPTGPAVLARLLGDLYGYEQMLPAEDQQVLLRLREWLQREVAPIANDQWSRGGVPAPPRAPLGELGVDRPRLRPARPARRPAGC